ncbi:hypothetical protein [Sphingobium aromaticiconvertens]|uniref:hypothetical protein n=1 Tax=Sphingobium aromaticiconvertens TaxID=365341 RepID=UPI0030187272
MILFVHLPLRGRIAFAGIMGTRFTTLLSPLLAAAAIALPAPAGAQEEAAPPLPSLPRPQTPAQPSPSEQRQGPELDVYRDVPGTAPAPTAPPPVTVTTPPPVIAPTPVPAPNRQATATPRTQPERVPERTAPPAARESGEATPSPAPVETPLSSGETIVAPQTGNVAESAAAPPPPTTAPPAPTGRGLPWGWIGAALAIVLAGGIALFLRRRPRDGAMDESDDAVQDVGAPEPLRPSPPAPKPRPTTTPQPAAERAWIDVELAIESARYSLLGVSVGYRLTLRNRGQSVASDMLVHALIGNADANQNELLRAFFAGTKGMPVHSVVSLAPGQTQILTNELRLEPDAIDPLELDGRLLLVPLIGFDVHYRWNGDGTPGSGRTGSAFIVGQEQAPPTQKLAPFRFDQGPRQYRDVGCRRTALSLAS